MMDRNHTVILAVLFVLIHCLLYWHYGIRVFYDSAAYIEAADYINEYGRLQDYHHLFYTVPILIMATFRVMFPGEIIQIIVFQCLFSALAVFALYKSAEKVFNSRLAGLMAGVIFLLWLDNIHWNITTMTESISCTFFCIVIYALTHMRNRWQDKVALAVLLVVVFFTRPTSVIIILGAFAYLITYYWKALLERKAILAGIASISLVAVLLSAHTMLDHWDFTDQYKKGNIITYADIVKGSALHHESLSVGPPSSTDFATSDSPIGRVVMFVVENPIYFFKTAALKIWYLVAFVRPFYSLPHNVYLAVWLILIYSLLVIGWRSTTHLPMRIFALTAIILNCGLIGVSSVDWDNRFYIPMEPGIVVLAGGGAAALLKKVLRLKRLEN